MAKTILHHLSKRNEENATDLALQFKEGDRWVKYRWQDYFGLTEAFGAALLSLDVKRGDTVALISDTRCEWPISDMAIMGIGAITVPIYPNNLDEDVEYILNDCKAATIILEDHEQLLKWKRIQAKCPLVKNVIVIERQATMANDFLSWLELIQKGREVLKDQKDLFRGEIRKSLITDIATILYTSGTTGRPKGVVLSHTQIMSEMEDVFSIVTVNEEDLSLTFLPYSHILGRVEAWGNIYAGYVLAFAESIDKIKTNLKEVKPTFLIAVPRIFEKIYAGILASAENSKTKAKIFKMALDIGKKVSEARQEKRPLGLVLSTQLQLAEKLVFNKVQESLGGRMRFAVSGGAPLSADVAKFFHGLGLLICEGYGLTETTAGVAFNTPLHYKFGTVGQPLADVEVKIAEDGEILLKSKKCMLEYFNNPDATAEAFDDGYFKTGDIGHIDEDGYLVITDRKKDLIKTAGGKYVAPQKLENLLKRSPYVSNVLIHGDQKKYIVALLTLNAKNLEDYAQRENIKYSEFKDLVNDPKVYGLLRDVVAEANTELASYESIKKFTLLPTDFTIEAGELTPSLKVKRKYCDQKFAAQIEELYE